uniref:NADH-ubiquinone oxidoreductase chain 5 n=1 Tax=Trigonopterus sp. 3 AH-2016 TaxID=1903837 RepID=A0A343C405_9CUCU|nr:NADH dehydrogenase subunit 5 [Trigonopterus sp. 3 AH-2016]
MIYCLLNCILFMFFSVIFYFSSLIFLSINLGVFLEFNIFSMNSVEIKLAFFFDWVALMFASFVFFISSMVILYSVDYMSEDMNLKRFIILVVLFVISMLVVIISSNLVFILLGWDGLGLVSYVLVIYYQNSKSNSAGMLTAISNRVGDSAILLGIALMMDLGGWDYSSMLDMFQANSGVMLISGMVILASFTKSAQIPFSSWLPAAMAAPTPVSSLVHSSTLVTAGVYLLFRFSPIILGSFLSSFCMSLSLLTMFMAGLGANFEYDFKKIIALSTLSQLGMMMFIYFMGEIHLAFFHLLMHAFFKALLFMCAGVIIHSLSGDQDIRNMGGLINTFPLVCSCFCTSNMALCGLPFLSGFYSKDLIAEVMSMDVSGMVHYIIFYFSVGLTVSYSMRLFFYIFMGSSNMSHFNNFTETSGKLLLKSMCGLVFFVIFSGGVLVWLSMDTPVFVILPSWMKLLTLVVIFMGAWAGCEFFYWCIIYDSSSLNMYGITAFLSSMWNFPILSTSSFTFFSLDLSKTFMKSLDLGWSEYYGSKGLFELMKTLISVFQLFSRNHLKVFLLIGWGVYVYLFVQISI